MSAKFQLNSGMVPGLTADNERLDAAKRTPEVTAALQELDARVRDLVERVELLYANLQPVLSPEGSPSELGRPMPSYSAPVAACILDTISRIHGADSRLNEIMNRLEI